VHGAEINKRTVGLETEAALIKDYQSTSVPGLLQIADYALCIQEAAVPKLAPERFDEQLEVKRRRQKRLTQEVPLRFTAVLDEAVLHRVIGGLRVMGAQLDRLIEAADTPNATLQVIPHSAGAYPAMDSIFIILEFASPMPSVVYVEGLEWSLYMDRPKDIERHQQVFDYLRAMALNPKESIE
jgi:hypothetical protein